MTSTLRRTSSAASAGRRSEFPLRRSPLNDNVFPLHVTERTQTLPECLGRATRTEPEPEPAPRFPIRGIFVGCWASTAKLRVKKMAPRAKTKFRLLIEFLLAPKSGSEDTLRFRRHSRGNGNPVSFILSQIISSHKSLQSEFCFSISSSFQARFHLFIWVSRSGFLEKISRSPVFVLPSPLF